MRDRIKVFFFFLNLLLLKHYWRIENINNKHCFRLHLPPHSTPPPFPSSFYIVQRLPPPLSLQLLFILSIATLQISFWSMSSPENLAEFRWNAQCSPNKSHLKASATSPLTHLSLPLCFSLWPCFSQPKSVFIYLIAFLHSSNLLPFSSLSHETKERVHQGKKLWERQRIECGDWPELTTMVMTGFWTCATFLS